MPGNGSPGGDAAQQTGVATFPQDEWSCCCDDTPCQDGLFCNGRERCNCWGGCEPPGPGYNPCVDHDPCTSDECDEARDRCPRTPLPGPGCPCTTDAFCSDDSVCTADRCDPDAATCQYREVLCDDGNICTRDSCDPATGCRHERIPDCCIEDAECPDDGNRCTEETCDPTTNRCQRTNAPPAANCDNGLWCDGIDTCDGDGRCLRGSSPCRLPCLSCDEATDACKVALQWCLVGNTCYRPGATNPADPCQECRPEASQTAWTDKAAGAPCNDGLFCTLIDRCSVAGICSGSGTPCPRVGCVWDCDEVRDTCTPAPAGTVCAPGPGTWAVEGICDGVSITCPAGGLGNPTHV